jgi:hypothetical protein
MTMSTHNNGLLTEDADADTDHNDIKEDQQPLLSTDHANSVTENGINVKHGHQHTHNTPASLPSSLPLQLASTVRTPYPLLITYFLLTFAQNLPATANNLILIRTFLFAPNELTWYYTLVFVPWTVRPVWGYISDRVLWNNDSNTSHHVAHCRNTYVIIGVLIASISCFIQQYAVHVYDDDDDDADKKTTHTIYLYAIAAFCVNIGLSMASTMCDTLSVEYGNTLAALHIHNYTHSASDRTDSDLDVHIHDDDDNKQVHNKHQHRQSVATDNQQPHIHRVDVQPTIAHSCLNHEGAVHDDDRQQQQQHLLSASTDEYIKSTVQSQCMFTRTAASLTAAGCSIILLALFSPPAPILIASAVYLCTIPTVLYLMNQSSSSNTWSSRSSSANMAADPLYRPAYDDNHAVITAAASSSSNLQQLYQALILLWRPVLFLFVLNLIPTSADAYTTYLYTQYASEFQAWQFSFINMIVSVGSLVGVGMYWKYCTRYNVKLVFVVCVLMSILLSFMQLIVVFRWNTSILHISDIIFIPAIAFISQVVTGVNNMPPIVLSAESTSRELHLEGTMYSICQAAAHIASLIGAALSAQTVVWFHVTSTEYGNLWQLIVTCHALLILPLFILPLLKTRRE